MMSISSLSSMPYCASSNIEDDVRTPPDQQSHLISPKALDTCQKTHIVATPIVSAPLNSAYTVTLKIRLTQEPNSADLFLSDLPLLITTYQLDSSIKDIIQTAKKSLVSPHIVILRGPFLPLQKLYATLMNVCTRMEEKEEDFLANARTVWMSQIHTGQKKIIAEVRAQLQDSITNKTALDHAVEKWILQHWNAEFGTYLLSTLPSYSYELCDIYFENPPLRLDFHDCSTSSNDQILSKALKNLREQLLLYPGQPISEINLEVHTKKGIAFVRIHRLEIAGRQYCTNEPGIEIALTQARNGLSEIKILELISTNWLIKSTCTEEVFENPLTLQIKGHLYPLTNQNDVSALLELRKAAPTPEAWIVKILEQNRCVRWEKETPLETLETECPLGKIILKTWEHWRDSKTHELKAIRQGTNWEWEAFKDAKGHVTGFPLLNDYVIPFEELIKEL